MKCHKSKNACKYASLNYDTTVCNNSIKLELIIKYICISLIINVLYIHYFLIFIYQIFTVIHLY